MKLKGINLFEQHVEKIVVGGIALVGLGVLSAQFLGSSNQIKVGNEEVSPEGAFGPVKKKAEELLARVRSQAPTLPDAPKVDVLQKFEAAVSGGVAPAPKLAGNFAVRPNIGKTNIDLVSGDSLLAEVTIPATSVPVARVSAGSFDPVEWATVPGLKPYLPQDQPFDKFSVSVEVSFNGKAFKDALTADPDGASGPIQPIPLGWVNNNVEILAVEVERQQLDASGGKGSTVILKPIPGRPDMLGQIAKSVKSAGDMPRTLDDAKAMHEGILRPAFYRYIAGEAWWAPTELQEGGAVVERVAKAEKRLTDVAAELDRLRNALVKQKTPLAERPGAGGGGGGGKGARGGGGGGEQPQERRESPTSGDKKPVKSDLERRIEKKELEESSLTQQLETLRLEASGEKVKPTESRLAVMDDAKVRLWAHDLQAEPGATYQYRVRVVANNPLFGREAALKEEQKARASEALLRGEWSEWSEPISVDQKTYYFITSASERDNLGPARASAELMQFYYGYYRRAALSSINPGDLFAGEVKLPPELVIYDLKKIAEGARPMTESEVAAGPEGEEGGGGGGKGKLTGGGRGRGELGHPAPAEAAQAAVLKDDLSKPGPEKLAVSIDAMLLDVASGPAPSAASIGKVATMRAFIRERTGQIVVKTPEQQQDDALFQRISRSAKLGEAQSKPKTIKKTTADDPSVPRRPSEDPTPPGGGGGGGGG